MLFMFIILWKHILSLLIASKRLLTAGYLSAVGVIEWCYIRCYHPWAKLRADSRGVRAVESVGVSTSTVCQGMLRNAATF